MHKTVRDLADELSISRQAVHQALDKLLDKEKINKKGNAFLLNKAEQVVIYDFFGYEYKENASSDRQASDKQASSERQATVKQESSELTTTLQSQNEFLMRELENKNKQINELHILLLKEKEKQPLIEEKKTEQEEQKRKWFEFWK